MRHRMVSSKVGRSGAHRSAMLANMICSLIEEKAITTTAAKARMARSMAEKMVTLAKNGTLAARRRAVAALRSPESVGKLFSDIAPQFADRAGGYTRILKIGTRRGNGAEISRLEWVGIAPVSKKKKTPAGPEAKKE
ncbi:MAG: 50S ribosomal protein L17 [Lentisphaerae bacterium]|nr:50S ribosomal protein L17 [Lentisphaerota bacterium]